MNAPARDLTRPERLRLRVEDYLLLSDSGALDGYSRTELIDGDIYVMDAQYSRHARTKTRLTVALSLRLKEIGSDLEALIEVAVRVNGDSMPEPDIVVTSWRGAGAVPVETVALIVEVSESTLDRDLGRKADLYAAAGVAEYWVIDLNGARVVVHEEPARDGYRGKRDVPLGGPFAAVTIDGLEVATANLMN